jgi:hypothetical protein
MSLAACAIEPRIETLDDLTNALKNNGIQFDSASPLDFSGMRFAQVDEGVRITGNGLHVELLRVEDDRTFKVVSGASAFLETLSKSVEELPLHPPEVITRDPFVVVIRMEPEPGQVRRVLDRLLPEPASE